MPHKVAIIGRGKVGSHLAQGLQRAGHEVRAVGKEPGRVRQLAQWGEVIILAVPFPEVDNAVREMGDAVRGKVLLDVTNALTKDYQLALGFTTSGAEELAKKAEGARVVKAFNTVFAEHMSTGKVDRQSLAAFVAGDDAEAKRVVLQLARDIGFDAIDAGPLKNARSLEALGFLHIQLGYQLGLGKGAEFRLLRA
jgi:8-hydroxy-5-deazaflavin:NADPH oxidoreductase